MQNGKLDYDGQRWIGTSRDEGKLLIVSMSDAAFQRHLNAYLASIGIIQPSYDQRYRGIQHLTNMELWRDCDDPDVQIFQHDYRWRM